MASTPPNQQDSPPGAGHKLKNRYTIERELGRGGIGVVYLARDERLHGMPVVIKFLLDASERHAWLAKKFLQEAEALTRINHPGVVRVIDRDTTEDGRPFFVMEFVSGEPLRAVMRGGGIDFPRAARILRHIGQALAAAHAQGVIHRDLKPENILLQHLSAGEEQAKLIDFGIAKIEDSQSGAATEVAMVAGSMQYISPEQLNAQQITPAADIYALGIIACELVTGRRPFNPDAVGYLAAAQQLAKLQEAEQIEPLRALRPDLPEAAEMLIRSALAFDPQRRPQNARIFGDELARALTGAITVGPSPTAEVALPPTEIAPPPPPAPAAVPAQSTTPVEGAPKAPGKSRIPWVIGIAAILLLGALAAIYSMLLCCRPQPSEAPPSTVAAPTLELGYSITLQKDPKRYPGSKPFDLPGEVIFSAGDRIRLNITSPQTGYLYIINEGPVETNGMPSYHILFPSTTSNEGSAQLVAGQRIRIPERGDGFVFDEQEGTEKLWLVWSSRKLPEFEAVRRYANIQEGGTIKDPAEVEALRAFIARAGVPANQVEKNEAEKRTIVRATGESLVYLVKLEHH